MSPICSCWSLVEMIGFVGKGAQRWLDLGFIRLQPSEFMKPAIVLVLARFYDCCPPATCAAGAASGRRRSDRRPGRPDPAPARSRHRDDGASWRRDRDVPRRPADVDVPGAAARARGRRADRLYDDARLSAQTGADLPRSRRATRSAPAITSASRRSRSARAGSGARAILNGSQSHLDYLPEGHTDFVFATMVEEWGLVGGALLIFAFAMVIRWGMQRQPQRPDPLRPARRGRPDDDHLLLCRDQPDDGDGPGAGGRHPPAAGQLWRIGGDDDHDLPRHADGARAPAADPSPLGI